MSRVVPFISKYTQVTAARPKFAGAPCVGMAIAMETVMGVLDLLIIYLACGAPFSVFQITAARSVPSLRYALTIIYSLLLWPLVAVMLIVNRWGSSAKNRARLEDRRIALERLMFADSSISTVFEFREVFYRFFGLVEAASLPVTIKSHELFNVTDHTNPTLASRCMARKNRARLEKHKARAGKDLMEFFTEDRRVEIAELLTASGHDFALTPPSRSEEMNLAVGFNPRSKANIISSR